MSYLWTTVIKNPNSDAVYEDCNDVSLIRLLSLPQIWSNWITITSGHSVSIRTNESYTKTSCEWSLCVHPEYIPMLQKNIYNIFWCFIKREALHEHDEMHCIAKYTCILLWCCLIWSHAISASVHFSFFVYLSPLNFGPWATIKL